MPRMRWSRDGPHIELRDPVSSGYLLDIWTSLPLVVDPERSNRWPFSFPMKSELIPRLLSCVRAATSRAIPPAIILFSVLFLAGSAYGQSAPGLQAPDKPKVKDDTPAAVRAARGEVPFNRMYGHLKPGAAKTKRLGQLSPSEQEKKKDQKRLQIGIVRSLDTPLNPLSDSELYTVTEGYIRIAGIVSEEAVGIRVQFKDMALPPGARVFVYSLSNPDEFHGPYEGRGPTGDGTFWTPAVRGDTAVIEYFTPTKSDSGNNPFSVLSIAHVYTDMFEEKAAGSCEIDVTSEWQTVAKSVGRIDFVSGSSLFTCTGTLLNNLANDQTPYFLTANHCINTQSEAQSATVYWNYNTGDDPPAGTPTTHGANLLATGESSDFTLLRLTGSLPGGLFFSGWDSSAFTSTAAGAGIHHPDGSHKRISFGTARQPVSGNCQGTQCLRVDWSTGVTEPGSSGSGIWIGSPSDPSGPRLIGNLIGGASACGASPSNMWDVYGRFSVTFPSISSFLDGSSCVTSLSPTGQNFTSSGGTGSFNVNAAGSCNWTAVPSDSFVTITSGSKGSGNGTVNFSVAANSGSQRTTTIVVAGQVFNITQGGRPRTLTVASSNPNSGISVTLTPADNNGLSTGTTQFTRIYDESQMVTLNAPGAAGEDLIFVKWLRDGADWSTSPVTNITIDVDRTMTAVYGPTPRFTLTVNSINPNSGVPITVSPNADGGLGNGTTQFTRTYKHFTTVFLTAPISAGGNNYFLKWQKNGVDLTNTRTTSVNMGTNHTMTAVYTTLPPQPPPTPTPTPSAPGQAVGYQIDPTHSGSQFDTVSPPLTQRWSRNLGNLVSYPVIVNNRIFVMAGVMLYALNGTTGATLWGPIEVGGARGVAYDSGRVFAVDRDGLLRAFDAATGTQAWSRELSGQLFSSPPTAKDGTVYVNGFPTLHAVSAQDGSIKWSTLNAGGFNSAPAVTANAVYVSYSCDVFSLSPSTGAIIWRLPSSCGGGGGRTPVFYNSRLYVRNNDLGNIAIDAATGIPVAEIEALPAPAFHGSTGFFLNFTTLEARDVLSGTLKWSFTGDGTLSSAPMVVNGVVYIGSLSGKLYALDENTGSNIWTGTVGAAVNRPDEHNSDPLNGLGAGEGLIVVPASNLLVAYEASPVPTTPVIHAEDGTNNAAALDSVTFVRGPFAKNNPNNFSSDQRTRIILLTSNLGLSQADLSDSSVLVVELAGVNLPVENVGPALIPGLSSSYIVVRIPDNVPTGPQELRVKLRGIASDARLLNISP